MKKCILSANCHGAPLKEILNMHPLFSKEWEVKYYINYEKETIPEEELKECDLLLHQGLDEKWEEHSAEYLLSRIPQKALHIALPNMMNFHLWPTHKANNNPDDLWRDVYVDSLIDSGKDFGEIIQTVLNTNYASKFDLKRMMQESLRREYQKNYYQRDKIFKFIEENWKTNLLFSTPHHPCGKLLAFVVNLILEFMDYKSTYFNEYPFYCDLNFTPVHPFFIKYYGLNYINEDTEYPIYGQKLTYKEHLMFYVDGKLRDIPCAYIISSFNTPIENGEEKKEES